MATSWMVLAVLAVLAASLGVISAQDQIDVCASNPCMHDGTCTPDGTSDYKCECATGFTGWDCEKVFSDACLSDPCQNGGTCTLDGNIDFTCTCPAGFTGHRCHEHVNGACLSNPCQNGGTCWGLDSQDSLICSCLGLFTGRRCDSHILQGELRANETGCCLSGPCLNGGTCTENADTGFSCECIDGFSGATCQSRGDFCLSGPCQHGGVCNEDTDTCTCNSSNFTGAYCEVFAQGVCLSDPCIYGDCVETDGGNSYQCRCYDSFTGSHCEMIGDSCAFGLSSTGGRILAWGGLTGLLTGVIIALMANRK